MKYPSDGVFVRDQFTWLTYVLLAYYAYNQASLGPIMPFLRDELHLSYTEGGLHFSAFAVGMVFAGLMGDRIVRYFGRGFTFWGGGGGMMVGIVVFTQADRLWLTLLSVLLMSGFGSLLLVTIQATLSDRHGEKRAVALTEANIAASICAFLSPLFVGGLQQAGFGWHAALYLMAVLWLLVWLTFRRTPLPVIHQFSADEPESPLPSLFWVFWLVLVLSVSVEWSLISWSADFLEKTVHINQTLASALTSVFLAAMIAGRITGAVLTRTYPSKQILLAALGVASGGFATFWLAPVAVLNLLGLFVAGLGVANLFPFGISTISDLAPDNSDTASARITLGSGLAILVTPLTLGVLADQSSIKTAFGAVAMILVIALVMVYLANHRAVR